MADRFTYDTLDEKWIGMRKLLHQKLESEEDQESKERVSDGGDTKK